MRKIIVLVIVCIFLASCSTTTQTTSGRSYLQKYSDLTASPDSASPGKGTRVPFAEKMRQVASVEPTLTFPARIGLARIENGRLSTIPGNEMEAWVKLGEKLGPEYGQLVPVNQLVVAMLEDSEAGKCCRNYENSVEKVIQKIRLAGARQHFDVVLIYEVFSKDNRQVNFLTIADLSIIGGFILPSRALEAEGFGNAILIDIFQGYPYGTIDVTVDKEEIMSTYWGENNNKRALSDKVKTQAALKMANEAEAMVRKLRLELSEARNLKK